MAAILLLSILSLLISHTYAQNEFAVTSPGAGDTVTLSNSALEGAIVQIEWTVADSLADRPVLIYLVRGDNLSNLTLIEQVESNAPNNGSYTWRGNYYGSALDYGFSDGTPSGCDYSIQLKVWTDIVYSPYFTIINPKDGGLDPASQCPSGDEAAVGPTSRTFTSNGGDSQETQDETSNTTPSTASSSSAATSRGSASGAATTDSTTGTTGGSTSDDRGNSGGGVSTKTVAIAVAIPVVVLLIVFGLIIWLGMRRGWFVKKNRQNTARDVRGENGEKGGAMTESGAGKAVGNTGEPAVSSVRELHANDLPHQLENKAVYELHEGEGGRQYGGRS